ncbi:hypothetical protein BDK51DRAFT_34568 [Blyttiomyces helicus]|uniref:Ribosome maturation protein SDO1/SBDS N-terminal domain-containing protein n=1 Tax=Blyttiomyces helicus TaxID=388810 RepID=A0A4P9WJY2_9FUNG|nr:hypothetical protein BDK51DRAFT_34568 [Blyttiomyces helicus]|eukprot:RKO90976.1 hypothetical protein BDK51DRAFT_34568 [Blyttiomyces helicus]
MPNVAEERIVLKGATGKEFFVYAEPDKTIPLIEVVQAFEVFEGESGGHTGTLDRPSKQQLSTAFNTDSLDAVVAKIVTEGRIVPSVHRRTNSKSGKANGHESNR